MAKTKVKRGEVEALRERIRATVAARMAAQADRKVKIRAA